MRQGNYGKAGHAEWDLQVIPGDYYIDFDNRDGRKSEKKRENTYSAKTLAKRRREKKRRKIKRVFCTAGLILVLTISFPIAGRMLQGRGQASERFLEYLKTGDSGADYPEELLEMLEKNKETYDFVTGYPDRTDYMGREIDLTTDYQAGQVPLLLQWDKRWGYDSYGQEMIGVAGCGPACMTMAYLYLTGDTSMNPRKMAEYAYDSGFYTKAGTSWEFFTTGAVNLGLSGNELPLGESQIENALDQGGVVICSMRPGDFTTTGHFILLWGYDEKGFYVNDPNSRKNSEKQWDFEILNPQIKCLWKII